jgi:ribosomal protein S18 acetylase RimI-like enzyme
MDDLPFTIRPARPDDVPAIFVLKWQLALAEGSTHTVRASEADWHRDMFGPQPHFSAIPAEAGGAVIGMAIIAEHFSPGWNGPLLVLSDFFVVPAQRRRGVGKALLAHAAAHAIERGAPYLELSVRDNNPARRLYRRAGFARVRHGETYVLAGDALTALGGAGASISSGSKRASAPV